MNINSIGNRYINNYNKPTKDNIFMTQIANFASSIKNSISHGNQLLLNKLDDIEKEIYNSNVSLTRDVIIKCREILKQLIGLETYNQNIEDFFKCCIILSQYRENPLPNDLAINISPYFPMYSDKVASIYNQLYCGVFNLTNDLRNINLIDESLSDTNYNHANFQGANLNYAKLTNIYILGANFQGANFRGTEITLAFSQSLDLDFNHIKNKSGSILTAINSIEDQYVDIKTNLMTQVFEYLKDKDISLIFDSLLDVIGDDLLNEYSCCKEAIMVVPDFQSRFFKYLTTDI